MSSRSLASARSKRTNETPQTNVWQQTGHPLSGRLRHLINRVLLKMDDKWIITNQQQQQQQQQQPPPAVKSEQQFKRLSVSDAVGLITLRLGHLEQWVIDTEHESETNGGGGPRLPDNSKIVDNSVFLSIVERNNRN